MVEQEFRTHQLQHITEKIEENCHYRPAIMHWMVNEAQESIEDDSETFKTVLNDYEGHKLNLKYNVMVEKRIRARLAKIRVKRL